MRILLGQLGSNGDCFYATVLAHQIKKDHPGSQLTWAISSLYKSVIRNNPHVDKIWEIPIKDAADQEPAWYTLETEVLRRQNCVVPAFDKIFLSQIWPNNFRNYDGTIRPSILRAYGGNITVPVDTVIILDEQEIQNVEVFRVKNDLEKYEHVILFESSSNSGQSYVTPEFAQEVANLLLERVKNACVIPSSHVPIDSGRPEIIDGSILSIRECAGLTHHCTQFVGCGSGLTVVATSGSAKKLPNLQLLNGSTSVYASFAHDFDYFDKPSEHFVELYDAPATTVADAIETVCREGVEACRARFHNDAREITFGFYTSLIDRWLLQSMKFADAARSTLVTAERYGWHPELLHFARYVVAPNVLSDPTCRLPDVEQEMKRYLDTVWSAL